eukprot:g4831.t1
MSSKLARKSTRIAVAISGGVDSSVAALLLKNKGYDVVGVHMSNWSASDEKGEGIRCERTEDLDFAKKTCAHLDIPMNHVSFETEYWNNVFSPMVEGYRAGVTPNPDVWCNREIKFKPLLEYARTSLGASYLATGHYARLRRSTDDEEETPKLMTAFDKTKDQSYFLCGVGGDSLRNVLFPLGDLAKINDVRRLAREYDLPAAERRDSQGICFIGKRKRFSKFMEEYTEPNPGPIVDDSGNVIGEHGGLFTLTVGQCARIGGSAHRWFVARKVLEENTIVCVPDGHEMLYSSEFCVSNTSWISGKAPPVVEKGATLEAFVRVRHQQNLASCTLSLIDGADDENGGNVAFGGSDVVVRTREPLRAVTPHQISAIYVSAPDSGDFLCLGGGLISDVRS